jgi:hypothetical protein
MTKSDRLDLLDFARKKTEETLAAVAARLLGVDVKAVRNAIRTDKLSDLRRQYRENPDPSNTQYGWIWTDDAKPPTVPVGTG